MKLWHVEAGGCEYLMVTDAWPVESVELEAAKLIYPDDPIDDAKDWVTAKEVKPHTAYPGGKIFPLSMEVEEIVPVVKLKLGGTEI
jgi:hypothetical protein